MSFKMFDLIFMVLATVPSVCNKRHTSCGDVSLIANKAISDSYESPRHIAKSRKNKNTLRRLTTLERED